MASIYLVLAHANHHLNTCVSVGYPTTVFSLNCQTGQTLGTISTVLESPYTLPELEQPTSHTITDHPSSKLFTAAMTDKVVLAFDVYGTILSTASIAEKLSSFYGSDAGPKIAAQWRRYQLEYTWRLNSLSKEHNGIATVYLHLAY